MAKCAKTTIYDSLPGAKSQECSMLVQSEKSKELAQNLAWEKEYLAGSGEMKPQKKCGCLGILFAITSILLLVTLVGWLIALTLVGRQQLKSLHDELDKVRAEVDFLKAKNFDRELFNDVKLFEDTVYTDKDIDIDHSPSKYNKGFKIVSDDTREDGTSTLEELEGITDVLEDIDDMSDEMDDDEGDDDEQGEESGDWGFYGDNTEKIGTTMMKKLTPADFLGTMKKEPEEMGQPRLSKMSELWKIMKTDTRRSDRLSDAKSSRERRSVEGASTEHVVDAFAAPRYYFAKAEDRRKTKKYQVEVDHQSMSLQNNLQKHAALRTARNSDGEESGGRPFIAAHFHGNTSHLNPQIHEHYQGNGLVRVAHNEPHNVWWPAPWTEAASSPSPTLTRSGHVSVHHTGVYLVYVQIYYLDAHDTAGWVLHRSGEEEDREPLLQCALASPSPDRRDKPNSCFSASALMLRAGDKLAVRNTGGDRHSLMQPEKSFIGLIKLADAA